MLMRRSALEQVGLFDEGYWMYMEDLDLCYRFAEAGWTDLVRALSERRAPEGGAAASTGRCGSTTPFTAACARFYRAHYAADNDPLLNLAVYSGIVLKLAASALRSAAARALARVTSAPAR